MTNIERINIFADGHSRPSVALCNRINVNFFFCWMKCLAWLFLACDKSFFFFHFAKAVSNTGASWLLPFCVDGWLVGWMRSNEVSLYGAAACTKPKHVQLHTWRKPCTLFFITLAPHTWLHAMHICAPTPSLDRATARRETMAARHS